MISNPPRSQIPTLSELPLVITLPRFTMRPIRESDVDDIWPYASDPEFPKMMSWNAHRERHETVEWVQSRIDELAKGTSVPWVIEQDGRCVGCIGLDGIRWEFRAWRIDRAELGYWLAPPLWGRGIMTEAATAATRWGFETLGLHKITIGCVDGNRASQRIIEKIGYRFLAVLEEDFWRDGRWQAHRRYELTAAEWGDSARTLRFSRPT